MIETIILVAAVVWAPLPPIHYDHTNPNMGVHYGTPAEVARWCRDPELLACAARMKDGTCAIILPHGATPASRIYRHEQGHCNGWPGDHPQDWLRRPN